MRQGSALLASQATKAQTAKLETLANGDILGVKTIQYRCSICRGLFERPAAGARRWMKSYCTKTGRDSRLYMVKKPITFAAAMKKVFDENAGLMRRLS